MLISKIKNHQITILFPLKKKFFVVMVILFSFLQAGNINDSINSKNFEKQTQGGEIYILDGTIISGAVALSNSEIIIIIKDTSAYKATIKPPLRKAKITKEKKGLSEKTIYKQCFEDKIAISNKDLEEKYKYWLIEFHATNESGQNKYDFSFLALPVFLEFLSFKKAKINFFRNSQKTFLPDRYCCIRPPPAYY